MNRIEGRRSRIMVRHLIELGIGTAAMASILTFAIYVRHWTPGVMIGTAVGIPVITHSVGGLIGAAIRTRAHHPPVVTWDQDGLTYLTGNMEDDVQLPWKALRGYRFTWEYPVRLKIRRREGGSFTIPLPAFSREDQALLLAELEVRTQALPDQRL